MQNRKIYIFVLAGLFFLVVLSLGNGIWGKNGNVNNTIYRTFGTVCHQIPNRSFKINDVQMAVNTRCFGIFSGLFAGWTLIPFLGNLTKEKKWPQVLLGVAVILQISDYTGNMFHVWENTNESRFILGILLGSAASVYLSDFFLTDNQKEINHG
jgi:uncharacterized membrane protein